MLFALFLATWLTVLLVLVGIVVVLVAWEFLSPFHGPSSWFASPEERNYREQVLGFGSAGGASRADPVCPQCRTVYNRAVVIRLLKQVTPETFEFAVWTTKFKCKQCPGEVVISGRRGE
jgi:hypothetical protein